MTMNYAERFAPEALEAFAMDSLTNVFEGQYDWIDVKTVNVFTNNTVAPTDYTASAGYGTPTLIGNTKQAMTVTGDKGFSALLDKLDMTSSAGSLQAGKWLATEIRQQITPTIDKYVFDRLYTLCPTGQISATGAVTSANAYTGFLAAQKALSEDMVPKAGRVAFVTPSVIEALKLDSNFVKASDLAQSEIAFNGMVGRVDGCPVIEVPDSIMNATDHHIDFIIAHRSAIAKPMKLVDYQIYETVPGYSGSQVDGRVVFDLFLLTAKNTGIYVKRHA